MSISISKIQTNQQIIANDSKISNSSEFIEILNNIMGEFTIKADESMLENLYSIKDSLKNTNRDSVDESEVIDNFLMCFTNFFQLDSSFKSESLFVDSMDANNGLEILKSFVDKSIVNADLLTNNLNLNNINTKNFDSKVILQKDFFNILEKNLNLNDLKIMIDNIINKFEEQPNNNEGVINFLNSKLSITLENQLSSQYESKIVINDKNLNTSNLKDDALDKLDDVVLKLNKINFNYTSDNNFKIPIEQKEIYISNPQQIFKVTLNKIRDAINKNITELKIHLKPKELGDILIKLTYNDGVIEGKIVANKTVTEILQTNIDTLKNDIKNTVNNLKDLNLDLMNEENSQNHGKKQYRNKNNQGEKVSKTFESYVYDTEEL